MVINGVFVVVTTLVAVAYAGILVLFVMETPQPQQVIVMVGGLQRSGTTVAAEMMVELLGASGMSGSKAPEVALERVRKWRGVSEGYFRDVLGSGGLEGKFVQNVYPYAYFLSDWKGSADVFAPPVPGDGRLLWEEWRVFWDDANPVLVEKTPENIAMTLYLQQTLAPRETAFLIVLRHPLAWALAIDKWLKNKWNRDKTAALRPVGARVAMWCEVVSRFFGDAPRLRRAAAFHAEHLDRAPPARRQLLLLRLASRMVGPTDDGQVAQRATISSAFRGYAKSNLQYVACWLDGGRIVTKKRKLKTCQREAANDDNDILRRREELAELRAAFEGNVSAFGYAFPDFADMLCAPRTRRCRAPDHLTPAWLLVDLGLRLDLVAPRYSPYLVM